MRNPLSDRILTAKILLGIFFTVGITGMALPVSRDTFTSLTPLALLLSITAVILFHKSNDPAREIVLFLFIFIASFIIEAIGVKTGRIFGSYRYETGLGPLIFETPLMIGANWALLVYCTAVIADRFPVSDFLKIIAGSALMLAYDLILEQAAPVMQMWSFEDNVIPWRNYASWFLLSIIFHSLLRLSGVRTKNRIAPFVLYVQAFFFIILIIILKFAR
ncbi:MAG: carotenoid biosynthesis protein [Bacteroidales bacterium]|jgi:putative membrane protein|nr:carotenoid biosynthesis protein [Bacteroidales bacterium]